MLGYNGEYFDADLGMIYLRARWYDPSTGRFHTRDPYQGSFEDPMSMQAYLFAHGDPEAMVDPSGNFTLMDFFATASVRAFNTSQQIQKFEKVLDPVIETIGSLYVALNLWSSAESVYLNAINGTGWRSPLAWSKQAAALLQAAPHQWELVKDFRTNISKKNPGDTADRVMSIGTMIARSAANLSNSGSRNALPYSSASIKRNGLPEFTSFVDYGAIAFISGPHGPGLTGGHAADLRLAQAHAGGRGTGGAWHHHEVMGIMQYVNQPEHGLPHAGGRFFYTIMKGIPKYGH
jgi:RHS repeat-associated protein